MPQAIFIQQGVLGVQFDFDPGPSVFNLSTALNCSDIFVSKLGPAGNFVWAKQMSGTGSSNWSDNLGCSISIDASGNIYTTGQFFNIVDFDPGPGVFDLSTGSGNNGDIFVSKLDAAGNFVWAKQMHGIGFTMVSNIGLSIALDAGGNIYTTGCFLGTTDFDPRPGVFNLSVTGTEANIYVSKLDPAGNFIWAKQMEGTEWSNGYSIALDEFANVYTTGYFIGTVDFDPGTAGFTLSSAGNGDIFVSKLDAAGNFVWAKKMGGTGSDAGSSIVLDAAKNIYTAGGFQNTVDFDPGTGVFNLTTIGGNDIFVHKMRQCTNSTSSAINASACSTYTLNGQTYTVSGVYIQSLINAAGCDSIITLNLSINNIYTAFNVAACDSYLWNAQTYTSSGTYRDTLPAANGCDSIITLNLLINSRSLTTINTAICPGQHYEGYTTVGTYIDTLIAANGCDSIRTINLTVKNNCSIHIPKAFTPNNDGLNDIIMPTINLPIHNYNFIIFNRYGQKIFETREYGKGWDGSFKGKAQPAGSYVYRIKFTNIFGWESVENGSVLLIR